MLAAIILPLGAEFICRQFPRWSFSRGPPMYLNRRRRATNWRPFKLIELAPNDNVGLPNVGLGPSGAAPGCRQRSPALAHSNTSSTRPSVLAGPSMPCVFAVFRLITSPDVVGACTGSSPGVDRYPTTSQLGPAASRGNSLDLFNACLPNDFPPARNV